MSLQDKAILVRLNISTWSARKTDNKASIDIVTSKSNVEDSGRFIKNLLPDNEFMKEVIKHSNDARNYFKSITLDWDGSTRLLPVDKLDDWNKRINVIKSKWAKAVKALENNYTQSIEEAERDLGELFDPNDYPINIEDKFVFNVDYLTVPNSDFRFEASKEVVDELRQSIENTVQTKTNDMVKEVLYKFASNISVLVDALTRDKGRIHTSLFINLKQLTDIAGSFNLFNDPGIAKIIAEAKELFVDTPEEVRRDPKKKKLLADKGNSILERINSYDQSRE